MFLVKVTKKINNLIIYSLIISTFTYIKILLYINIASSMLSYHDMQLSLTHWAFYYMIAPGHMFQILLNAAM